MFQALIAETVDPVEAMDLFRHTTELGNHVSCYLELLSCNKQQEQNSTNRHHKNILKDNQIQQNTVNVISNGYVFIGSAICKC